MTDFKIRDDGVGHLTMSNPDIGYQMPTLEQIIMQEYPYIYEKFTENPPFVLSCADVGLFKEIVHENKVVGFSGYDCSSNGVMVLKYIYVLPEYRGNNLLIKDLLDTKNLFEKQGFPYVSIDTPNWFVIQSLMNHGYAKEYNDHIIISKIPLSFPYKKADKITQSELAMLEKMGLETNNIKSLQINTTIYDRNIKGCVDLNTKLVSGMCDEDIKHHPDLIYDRWVDPIKYFEGLEKEIEKLVEDGVLSYGV